MRKGQYIVFEGPGFSGKSTVMRMMTEALREMGFEVVETREPGGSPGAEAIREEIFREKALGNLTPMQETTLFYEARAINHTEVVIPNTEKGIVVLKDRDHLSTFKYQEISGMDRSRLASVHQKQYVDRGFLEPDLRLVLQINQESLGERMGRGSEGDPFDDIALDAIKAYDAEALDITRGKGMFAKNTEVVDANWPVEIVAESCLRIIKERLGLKEDTEGKRRGVEY